MAAGSERRPQRRCCACMQSRDKAELLRLVRGLDGMAVCDIRAVKEGRGAYICRSADCLRLAIRKKSICRSLRCEVSDDLYEQLGELIEAG